METGSKEPSDSESPGSGRGDIQMEWTLGGSD